MIEDPHTNGNKVEVRWGDPNRTPNQSSTITQATTASTMFAAELLGTTCVRRKPAMPKVTRIRIPFVPGLPFVQAL